MGTRTPDLGLPSEAGKEGTSAVPGLGRRVVDVVGPWLAVTALAVADYVPDFEFDFSLTYVFPIAWAAWRDSRASATWLALASAVADTVVDVHLGRYPATLPFLAWNVGLQFALLSLGAWTVDLVKRSTRAERALAAQLAVANRQLDEEMQRVGAIQVSLLPQVRPAVPGLSIASYYAPSSRAGGDYYDYFPLPDGRLGVLVSDASGHGPSAAILMTMTRVLVHAAREVQDRPERVLEVVNVGLVENVLLAHFVTACYLVVDPRSGQVEFALAGHPPPLVRRARDGTAAEVGHPAGPPLGLDPTARYARQRATLDPGDALVLVTDGLPEARDARGELLGDERVLSCISSAGGGDPDLILGALRSLLARHLGPTPPEDDITMVVLQASPLA